MIGDNKRNLVNYLHSLGLWASQKVRIDLTILMA